MSTQTRSDTHEAGLWASAEFGEASLGHITRTRRLVRMGQSAFERPGGRITSVFETVAEREAAYRFVESPHVDHREISSAASRACARRSDEHEFVYVAVDGCTLTLTDRLGSKAMGPINTAADHGRGVRALNAVAISPQGVPLGMAGQLLWLRAAEKTSASSNARPFHAKESAQWIRVLDRVNESFNGVHGARRWFQLDAEGDFRQLLQWAAESDQWLTVRAGQNRRVVDESGRCLWPVLQAQRPAGSYDLPVRAGPHRQARLASMEVRYKQVTLRPKHAPRTKVALYAVHAREVGPTPDGESPIEWLLLTNVPVKSFADALRVIEGYRERWRVEDFHKAWKSCCKIEQSQLHGLNFAVWATIMSSVAIRIETLKHLSRDKPDTPASEAFSEEEIEAVILLKNPKNHDPDTEPTVGQMIRWIADMGGYTGKSSGGPPGTITISRGWARIEPAMVAVSRMRERSKT